MELAISNAVDAHPIWKHFTTSGDNIVRCRYCQVQAVDGDLDVLMGHLNEAHSSEDLAELQRFVEAQRIETEPGRSILSETVSSDEPQLLRALKDIFAKHAPDHVITPEASVQNVASKPPTSKAKSTLPSKTDSTEWEPTEWKFLKRFPTLEAMTEFLNVRQAKQYYSHRKGYEQKIYYKSCIFDSCKYRLMSVVNRDSFRVYDWYQHNHVLNHVRAVAPLFTITQPAPTALPTTSKTPLPSPLPSPQIVNPKTMVIMTPGPLTPEQHGWLKGIGSEQNIRFVLLKNGVFGFAKGNHMISFKPERYCIAVTYHEGCDLVHDVWPLTSWEHFLPAVRAKCAIFFARV